jgi:hypothetical protein
MATTPVQSGARCVIQPMIPADDKQVMDSQISGAEYRLLRDARLPLLFDPPSPIDQLRKACFVAARPLWERPGAREWPKNAFGRCILKFHERELTSPGIANRYVTTEAQEFTLNPQ